MCPRMQTAANLMPIPGHIDPVPVPRSFVPRSDGRIDLLGLTGELGAKLGVLGRDTDRASVHYQKCVRYRSQMSLRQN